MFPVLIHDTSEYMNMLYSIFLVLCTCTVINKSVMTCSESLNLFIHYMDHTLHGSTFTRWYIARRCIYRVVHLQGGTLYGGTFTRWYTAWWYIYTVVHCTVAHCTVVLCTVIHLHGGTFARWYITW